MIETIVLNYLKTALNPVDVGLERTENLKRKYILFEKISSSKINHLKSARLAFQSYDTSLAKAAKLNEQVKVVVENLTELNEIVSVSLDNDYNFTDTSTKEYRYQAIFDIKYY